MRWLDLTTSRISLSFVYLEKDFSWKEWRDVILHIWRRSLMFGFFTLAGQEHGSSVPVQYSNMSTTAMKGSHITSAMPSFQMTYLYVMSNDRTYMCIYIYMCILSNTYFFNKASNGIIMYPRIHQSKLHPSRVILLLDHSPNHGHTPCHSS